MLEITEQAFYADLDSMRQTVERLVEEGVSVAVDDFGTGYSSLRYLQMLDLDVLKIDRTFVAGIGRDSQQERLLDGITALARSMNLRIVAEGIETAEQLALLRTFGCELGQGYLFSPPLSLFEVTQLLRSEHRYAVASVPPPRVASDVFAGEPTA